MASKERKAFCRGRWFPMLEDVFIESWQEGTGAGNPYTSMAPSRAYGVRIPQQIGLSHALIEAAKTAGSISLRTYQKWYTNG